MGDKVDRIANYAPIREARKKYWSMENAQVAKEKGNTS